MEPIYADYSISMTEFKKNPASVLRDAGTRPVAVLNHNRPAFHMVNPEVFEALVDWPSVSGETWRRTCPPPGGCLVRSDVCADFCAPILLH